MSLARNPGKASTDPPGPGMDKPRDFRIAGAALAFAVVFLAHFLSSVTTSFDSKWSLYLSMSLLREGNLDLDEYEGIIAKNGYFAVKRVDGHLRSIFPVGTPVLTAPLVYLAGLFYKRTLGMELNDYMRLKPPRGLEVFIASIIVTLAAMVIYRTARLLLGDFKRAVLAVFIFAFCTSAWSTASRGLWQHGPSMLFLSLSLYLFLLGERGRPRAVILAGFTLACAYVIRPTNAIPLALFTLYVTWRYRRQLLPFLGFAALVLVPFVLYNRHVYGTFLSPYYAPERILTNPRFLEALAGTLFSPARGLFVYSPVLLLALVGVYVKRRRGIFTAFDALLLAVLLLHWTAISGFRHWWGGHGFGPRLFSDMIPLFIYFLLFALDAIPDRPLGRRVLYTTAFAGLVLASFFINLQGAVNKEVYTWNWRPVNVDTHAERLWDWHDIQFLRGIR